MKDKFLMTFIGLMVAARVSLHGQNINSIEKIKSSGHAPVNGISMYYEVYGSGEMPLVLIHGGGSTIQSNFANIIPLLASGKKIIAVEMQAHGRTSDRNAPESFTQDADDVAAILAYLRIPKADFLGFSDGGCTTMQIAMRHSNLVNKIVVVSASYQRAGMAPGFFEGLEKARLADMPAPLQTAFLKVTPSTNKLQVMFDKDRTRRLSFKDWSDEDLRSITAPTLLIMADHDVVTAEQTLKMSRLIPKTQLIILPGVHGSCLGEICSVKKGSNQPALTVALIAEFLHE